MCFSFSVFFCLRFFSFLLVFFCLRFFSFFLFFTLERVKGIARNGRSRHRPTKVLEFIKVNLATTKASK